MGIRSGRSLFSTRDAASTKRVLKTMVMSASGQKIAASRSLVPFGIWKTAHDKRGENRANDEHSARKGVASDTKRDTGPAYRMQREESLSVRGGLGHSDKRLRAHTHINGGLALPNVAAVAVRARCSAVRQPLGNSPFRVCS